jgi:hypothetical protein
MKTAKQMMLTATIVLLGVGSAAAVIPFTAAKADAPKTQGDQTQTPQEPKADTQRGEQSLIDALRTRIALAQAQVAELDAKVALEIEKLPDRAAKALDDADARLLKAKETATAEISQRIDELRQDVRAARDAIVSTPAKAQAKLDELVTRTQERIAEYQQVVLETDEAQLLKKRYAELEAQAALLKARLAEKADETGESALSHLDKARAWYAEAKTNTAKKWQEAQSAISDGIDAAKQAIRHRREEAGETIIDLSKRAAELVKGSESEMPPTEPAK